MKLTLSFDNGPTEATAEVLDVLSERGIKSSFFVIGDRLVGEDERALADALPARDIGSATTL
ncbi:polysaccharide deacetylase family protein [Nocardia sp. SC052]|uniref:polysaccharide deacetylase family protein n=1 Tax=Nocardia sichangensis TaxID=3385975 RepID=UPI0039A2FF41